MTQQQWSKAVRARAGYRCELCGADGATDRGRLESHHIIFQCQDETQSRDINNGVCLCRSCHQLIHGGNFLVDDNKQVLFSSVGKSERRDITLIMYSHVADALR